MTHAHAAPLPTDLISVEAHLADILSTIRPLAPIEVGLTDAHGLVLAEDVAASHPLPSFDNSAMDGYAVRVQDVASASQDSPVTLPVVGEVAAGDTGAEGSESEKHRRTSARGAGSVARDARGSRQIPGKIS